MKLLIQIPCYNEEQTLGITLMSLPRNVEGFSSVEWLVVDDGSQDRTIEVAKIYGVQHVVRHAGNKGLASAFMTGIDACLSLGADVIVNTDADNQYNADDIPLLVQPILMHQADMVIGARPISSINHFSTLKKYFQKIGSWIVRLASGTNIPDAPSGFRAMSRSAAQKLVVFNSYTYTIEGIIQAGRKNISITSVPVRVNEDLRPSRLIKSASLYMLNVGVSIIRILIIYKPFLFFGSIGAILFTSGFFIGVRFLWQYLSGDGYGHIQSLILAAVLLVMGFQAILIAFVAELQSANRKLLEDIRYKIAKMPTEATFNKDRK